MPDEPTNAAKDWRSMVVQLALCAALIAAIGGLVYVASVGRLSDHAGESHAVITGKLRVSYMLITLKTATSEEAGGAMINASRVEYFPTYVLVTTEDDVTVLWRIDRLKKLEVSRAPGAAGGSGVSAAQGGQS